jgi:hypothetical protein
VGVSGKAGPSAAPRLPGTNLITENELPASNFLSRFPCQPSRNSPVEATEVLVTADIPPAAVEQSQSVFSLTGSDFQDQRPARF